MLWRRSYDVPPPPLADDDPLSQARDPRYAHLPAELLPRTECLKDVLQRHAAVLVRRDRPRPGRGRGRCWSSRTATRCARWSSTWTGSATREIAGLNIPTGIPLVYELDADFRPKLAGGRYLDPEAAAAAAEAVANQGR